MRSSATEKAPQSTISRLESKYSDILDRVAKRKAKQQQEKEDRDKTLEPEYRSHMPVPLMKSQTTANVARSDKPVSQKERTPFRLDRNKSKYNSEIDVKMKRSELIGLSGNSNSSNFHDSYTKMKSNDSGYYDAYRGGYGKENVYKSKYDPDILLSEMSSANGNRRTSAALQQQPYTAGSSTSRQIKPYKRTESGDKRRTAINLYELVHDEDPELEDRPRRHQYMQRKSTGNQLRLENHRSREYLGSTDDLLDAEKTERENKRKEIQSLIMKYAQMDDFSGKSTIHEDKEKEKERERREEREKERDAIYSSKIDPWDSKSTYSPVVLSKKSANPLGKSQTMANIASLHDTGSYSSWYNLNYSNGIVPIRTNLTPSSSSKPRMSKALSTFVRVLISQTRFSFLLLAFYILISDVLSKNCFRNEKM